MSNHKSVLLATASDAALGLKLASEAAKEGSIFPPIESKKFTKTHTTAAETVKMHGILKDYLHKQSDGTWKYADGWSDAKIAEEIGRQGITANHVARVRVELFGQLINPKQSTQQSDMLKRLEHLEQMFNQLAAEAGSNLRIASPAPGWTKPGQ